jgi:hypothetical protein
MLKCIFLFLCLSLCFAGLCQTKAHYGRNVVAISPLINNGGPGAGLSYERFFVPSQKWSYSAELAFCDGEYIRHSPRLMTSFKPGLRYYPGNSQRVASYSVAWYCLFAYGSDTQDDLHHRTQDVTRGVFGMMIGNAFHLHAGPKVRITMEISAGMGTDDVVSTSIAPVVQTSVGVGRRW